MFQVTGEILKAIINGVFGVIDIKRGEFEFELSSNVKRFYVVRLLSTIL